MAVQVKTEKFIPAHPTPKSNQKLQNLWDELSTQIEDLDNEESLEEINISRSEDKISLSENNISLLENNIGLSENNIGLSENTIGHLDYGIGRSENKKNRLEKFLVSTPNPKQRSAPSADTTICDSAGSFSTNKPLPLLNSPIDIQTSEKDNKIKLLEKIVNENPGEDTGWVWLSLATDDPDRRFFYLEKVLQINPANEIAEQALQELSIYKKKILAVIKPIIAAETLKFQKLWEKIATAVVIIIMIIVVLSFGLIGFLIYKTIVQSSPPFLAGSITDIIWS